MIELENITKTYKVAKRNAGLKNAFKSYFKREYTKINALDNISFKIQVLTEQESPLQLRLCVEY